MCHIQINNETEKIQNVKLVVASTKLRILGKHSKCLGEINVERKEGLKLRQTILSIAETCEYFNLNAFKVI